MTISVGARTGNYGPQVVETLKSVVTVDVGTLNPGATTRTFSVPGAKPTDGVYVNPSPALNDLIFLIQMHAGTDTVDVVFFNFDAAPILPGPLPWIVNLFRSP